MQHSDELFRGMFMPPKFAGSAVFTAFAAALMSIPVQAQDDLLDTVPVNAQATPFRQLLGVEVTGTAIINPKARERLPLTVIERRDIERSGASTLPDLLNKLPMVSNSSDHGVLGGGQSETVSVGLRGERNSTLVLLNGIRLPTHSVSTQTSEVSSVHLMLIPLSAVERIEILREGASTLYGSDAIAGVINIITRTSLKGWHFNTRNHLTQGGAGRHNALEVSWGRGDFAKHGYQFLVSAAQSRDQPLYSRERPEVWDKRVFIRSDGGAGYVWPANVYDYTQRRYLPSALYSQGQCEGEHIYAGEEIGRAAGVCFFDRTSIYNIYPAQTLTQFYLQGRVALAQDHSLYLEHAETRSKLNSNAGNNFAVQYDPATTRGYFFGLHEAQPVQRSQDDTFRRTVLGVQGTVADHQYKLSLFHGMQANHAVLTGYMRSPAAGYFTPEELATAPQQLSEATWQKIRQLQYDLPYQNGESANYGLDAKISNELQLANGLDAQYAIGVGARVETMAFERDISDVSIRGRRNVSYTLGEWAHPVNEALSVAAGVRADNYSDVGTASALKVSARYQHSQQWLLRGAVGNGFRAPALALTAPGSPAIITSSEIDGRPVYVFTSGNPQLKPEQSRHFTVGAQWTEGATWVASVDLWALVSRGVTYIPDAASVASDPVLRQRYERPIDFANTVADIPRNAIGLFLQPQNLAQRNQHGIDYQFTYRQPLQTGTMRLQWAGSWMLRSMFRVGADEPQVSDLGNYLIETSRYIPRHRWAASAIYEPSANHRHQLTLNYMSGNTELLGSTFAHKVNGHWTLDWQMQFVPVRGLTLGMGIINVTNRLPPGRKVTTGPVPGVDTRYGDFRGRTLTVSLDSKF